MNPRTMTLASVLTFAAIVALMKFFGGMLSASFARQVAERPPCSVTSTRGGPMPERLRPLVVPVDPNVRRRFHLSGGEGHAR
jgi:hypothetical protein